MFSSDEEEVQWGRTGGMRGVAGRRRREVAGAGVVRLPEHPPERPPGHLFEDPLAVESVHPLGDSPRPFAVGSDDEMESFPEDYGSISPQHSPVAIGVVVESVPPLAVVPTHSAIQERLAAAATTLQQKQTAAALQISTLQAEVFSHTTTTLSLFSAIASLVDS